MLELNLLRKNKINLADYNSQQEIENRILMSDFSPLDLKVLEEILFSPLKMSFKKLARSLQISENELSPILDKLAQGNLLSMQDDSIVVDKEIRKCFEFQMQRFDADFKPDMEFIQGLLRKVPIHLLPIWYAIPRSSNNIFESIIEKYLLTPQIFQRYLNELNFHEGLSPNIQQAVKGIKDDLFARSDFTLTSSDVIAKYNLTRHDFEEVMLLLEFHFIGTVHYVKEEDHWHEIITPFYEWHQYLRFLQDAKAPTLPPAKVCRHQPTDFAFIEEMIHILSSAKTTPLPIVSSAASQKLCQIQLAQEIKGHLKILDSGKAWLGLTLENKALYLYRHIVNSSDRHARDVEKSIQRVMHGQWILFDHFIQGAMVPLNVDLQAVLKKNGNQWKYTLAKTDYSEEEKKFIYAGIFGTLFECGLVSTGTYEGQDCFAVTSFGQKFFEG